MQYRLSPQDKANLSVLLPPKFLQHSDSLALLACYGNHTFPATALHYLERRQWQDDTQEPSTTSFDDDLNAPYMLRMLGEVEALLASRQLWRALRDVYMRAIAYPQLDEPTRDTLRFKALWLSMYRVPHPILATQLMLDAIKHDELSQAWLTEETLLQLCQRCISLGWIVQLDTWLSALAKAGRSLPEHEEIQEHVRRLQTTPSLTPPHEIDTLKAEAAELRKQATLTRSPEEARHLFLKAAKLLSSSLPTHEEASQCWRELLQHTPTRDKADADHMCWQALYETTVPTQLWDLLSSVLRGFPTRDIQLPSAPRLRQPLLVALEQGSLPELDPVPLLLVAFQQNPLDQRRFQALFMLLQESRQWALLRRIFSLRLAYLCVPSLRPTLEQGVATEQLSAAAGHKLPDQVHADLAALLDAIQRHTPEAQGAIFSAFTMTMSFAPHEDALLSQLAQWSYERPPDHPVHDLLQHLALEGRGDTRFQLEIAERLNHAAVTTTHPNAAAQAAQIYEQILNVNPGQLEALQQARELAIRQRRYEDALELLLQECKHQQDKERKVLLLLQMSNLLSARLGRHKEAMETCQEALRLKPQHKLVLRQLAALLEHQQQYQRLLPILGQLLPQLDVPAERRAVLRKLTRFALHPAKDHTTVLRALRDLLQQPQTTPECLDALDQLLQLPKAQAPLLSFLLDQEQSIDSNARHHIKLLIIRLMFRLLRFQEARSRLKQFLEEAQRAAVSQRLPMLQQCEEVAIEHRAWRELADTLQAQIQLLHTTPHALPSLGSLYMRYANVCQHLLDDQEAAYEAHRLAILYAPQSAEAHEPVLRRLLERGAYLEGCALLQAHADRLPPNQAAAALTRLAHIQFEHLSRPDLARRSLEEALELNPRHTPAIRVLTQLPAAPR